MKSRLAESRSRSGGKAHALSRLLHAGIPVPHGFVVTNAHPTYTCPNGREDYYLIHLQDASQVTLRNNIIFGNNAPGRCNELLKVNRGDETAYPVRVRDLREELRKPPA